MKTTELLEQNESTVRSAMN